MRTAFVSSTSARARTRTSSCRRFSSKCWHQRRIAPACDPRPRAGARLDAVSDDRDLARHDALDISTGARSPSHHRPHAATCRPRPGGPRRRRGGPGTFGSHPTMRALSPLQRLGTRLRFFSTPLRVKIHFGRTQRAGTISDSSNSRPSRSIPSYKTLKEIAPDPSAPLLKSTWAPARGL